jgi:hypothetical protein
MWRSVVSPYINRFLQPDSIIPNPANPQSWNRYSYVTNRPVNFNDPTGHTYLCEEECEERQEPVRPLAPKKQDDGEPEYKPKKWWKYIGNYHDCELTYKECFDDWGLGILVLSDYQRIDQKQFEQLLKAVYYDLKIKDAGLLPLISWWPTRRNYDTPFWNPDYPNYLDPNTQEYVRVPRKDVEVCFDEGCYKRSDVNYFAQGMWGAISGQSLEETVNMAANYKAEEYGEVLSADTQYWIAFGYNKVSEYDSINLMESLLSP